MNGTDLLTDFREQGGEGPFNELVRRYTNLVYSIANRRLSNATQAQEVAQTVFIRLARVAPRLRDEAELVAWLHRTTLNASIDLWRSESRRRAREEQAVAMQTLSEEDVTWNELAPLLDEALNDLRDNDRHCLLLRYFDHKSMREVGAALGISEDAAKVRVSRAIERLRQRVAPKTACTAAGLAALLSNRAVEAAPAAVLAALLALKFAAPVGLGASTALLAGLLLTTRAKLLAGAAALSVLGVTTFLIVRAPSELREPSPDAARATINQPSSSAAGDTTVQAETNETVTDGEIDPRKLLQNIVRARQQIISGQVELELSTERSEQGRRWTREKRLLIEFTETGRRVESFGREYSHTTPGVDDSQEADARRKRADSIDPETGVREGLLKPHEAHEVTVCDGATMAIFRESDGRGGSTTVDDCARGAASRASYFFDPRCLGLTATLHYGSTVENSLGLANAKAVTLLGPEPVDGVGAWHVRVVSQHDYIFDFWIDSARPTRLLKLSERDNTVVSTYSETDPRDPLPMVVTTTTAFPQRGLSFTTRFTRKATQVNVPIDDSRFTLDGLNMPLGTTISDVRNHRIIGTWTGAGLSPNFQGTNTLREVAPNRSELFALLDQAPASPDALDAAQWLIRNTPDGPQVDKAVDVIVREHSRDTNLLSLVTDLERLRPRGVTNLLTALLNENPSETVRGNACLTLALLAKQEARFGTNKPAAAKAEQLLERVIAEFGHAKQRGYRLSELAKPHLMELRTLGIGHRAPEIDGVDLDGHPMRLSDFRGQVVVLAFWFDDPLGDWEAYRKMAERFTNRPFAMVGVNTNEKIERAREMVEKHNVTWPSFRGERFGPIYNPWNANGATLWIIDADRIIRHRDLRGGELIETVEKMLGPAAQ